MTLPYALAKELKDKGWPQPYFDLDEYRPAYRGEFIWEREPTKNTSGEGAYSPSLSELIEGCPRQVGNSVFVLHPWIEGGWHAAYETQDTFEHGDEGKTPEEAVARLWLKLQGFQERQGANPSASKSYTRHTDRFRKTN